MIGFVVSKMLGIGGCFLYTYAYNVTSRKFILKVITMKVTKVSPVLPIAKSFLHDKYTDPYSLRNKQNKSFKGTFDKELCRQSKIDIKI